jgi:hypothetical protein
MLLGGILLPSSALPVLAHAATPAHRSEPRPSWNAGLWQALPHAGSHFLYVDNGGSTPSNGISGYRIAPNGLIPTPGSPYLTGGDHVRVVGGLNDIAISTLSGPCLFHTEDQLGLDEGQIESFAIDRTTGALTEVAITKLPGAESDAGDVHVAADGRFIYVDSYADLGGKYYLDVLSVGRSCRLTLASSMLASGSYFTIALVGADGLLGVNTFGNTLDMYHIINGTQLRLVTSTPSQVFYPSGAASGQVGEQTYVFNGINRPTTSEVETHTVNGQGTLGNVAGSPAFDGNGIGGPYVLFDAIHQQVIESENSSKALGVFGVKNSTFALLGRAPVTGGAPDAMAQLGSALFVQNGTVDACLLRSGAATCMLVVSTLHLGQGIGVL